MAPRPVVVPIKGDTRHLEASLRSIDGRLARTQQTASRFGSALAAAFAGGAVLRGLSAVATTTAEFDTVVREAGSAAGASRREMDLLGKSARRLGVEQKLGAVGATEAAKAQRELIKAGLSVKDALGGATRAVLTAASADGADITRTSEAVAQALMMFEMRGKDARKVADQFATVAATTSSSIEGVAESFVTGSAAARQIGVSFKDTNVTLAALALAGTKGAEAGTAMKSAYMQLAKPTDAAKEAMRKYGLELFDGNKNLKSAREIAGELERGLGGLSNKTRTATLQTLAGTYGFRTLAALMQQGSDGAGRLTEAMGKQGTAAKMAADRNAGLGGTIAAAKAGWQEFKLVVGEAIAPQATKALQSLTRSLSEAGKSGELKELLGDLGDGLGTVVQVGETAANAGGALVKAWSGVPRPMRDAAAAMTVAALAAAKLNAALGITGMGRGRAAAGGAASAAAAGGLAAGGRNVVVSPALPGPVGLRGVPGMYALQRSFGDSRIGAAMTATGARNIGWRGGAAMAGAGALGGVLGGGNMLQAGASGAMAGMMLGGPWGAAGGAIAAAAGTGLVNLLKGRAANAAAEMGRRAGQEVQRSIGRGFTASAQATLTQLRTETAKAQAALDKEAGRGGAADPDKTRDRRESWEQAARREGRAFGRSWQQRVSGTRFQSTTSLSRDFISRAQNLDTPGQKEATRMGVAYVRELERQGKLTKGATERFKKELRKYLHFDEKATVRAQLRVDLKKDAGKVADELKSKLTKNGKLSIDVTVPTKGDLDIGNLLKSAKRQREELRKIEQGRTGASKKEKDAAKDARVELDKLTARYERKTREARKEAAANQLQAERKAAQQAVDPVGRLADNYKRLADAKRDFIEMGDVDFGDGNPLLNDSGPSVPTKPRKPQGRRRGGRINRFQSGGMVPVAVSPGEAIQYPNGSWGMVPGEPVAADNVFGYLPVGAKVFTGHGQALLAAGASPNQALANQLPHFQKGGSVGPARVAQAARSAGLSGTRLVTATAIAGAESGYRPGATGVNKDARGRVTSIDRGAWQINSVHKQYDARRLFELGYNARAMAAISKGGANWSPWVTYKTGAYKTYMTGARAAAVKSRGGAGEFGDKSYKAPIILGRSKAGRTGLVEDAFSQGFQRGLSGYGYDDRRKFGSPILRGISDALASGTYERELTARGGGSGFDGGSGIAGKGWLRPTASGAVSSNYGRRRAPTKGASSNHDGVDIGVPVGTPVRAVKAGTVTKAGPNGGYGNYVRLAHSGGYASFYAHLSSIGVARGDRVKRGQKIALSGNTGTSTGPHLHFGMAKGGRSVNPASIIKFARGGLVGRKPKLTPQQKFRRKGLTGGIGDVNIAAGLGRGGSDFYKALAAATDDALWWQLDIRRQQLQQAVNRGGDARFVARARAALSIVEEEMGTQVGRAAGQALKRAGAITQNLSTLQALHRAHGIEGSPAAIAAQIAEITRFQSAVPKDMQAAQQALRRAERRGDKAAADETRNAIKELGAQSLEASATMADLQRAAAEAARAQTEEALARGVEWAGLTTGLWDDVAALRAQGDDFQGAAWAAALRGDAATRGRYELQAAQARKQADDLALEQTRADRRVGDKALDLEAAWASLTETLDDDLAVARKREAAKQAALDSAVAAGDTDDQVALIAELKAIRDEIKAGNAEQKASTEQQLELERQRRQEAEATIRALSSQNPQQVFAGAISGVIGGQIRTRVGFPAGGVRY